MKTINALAAVLCITLTSGCAAIFGDKSDQITIHSGDPAAKISVNGNQIGTGSAVYSVPAGKMANITASKPGCFDTTIQTDQSIRGATWLDILFWPGFIVDAATGDMHKTDPTDYVVTPNCNKS